MLVSKDSKGKEDELYKLITRGLVGQRTLHQALLQPLEHCRLMKANGLSIQEARRFFQACKSTLFREIAPDNIMHYNYLWIEPVYGSGNGNVGKEGCDLNQEVERLKTRLKHMTCAYQKTRRALQRKKKANALLQNKVALLEHLLEDASKNSLSIA